MNSKITTLNPEVLYINPEQMTSKIIDFIRKATEDLRRDGIILGLSGGLDSTVVAALSVQAVGNKKVLGLIMPEKEGTPGATDDALFAAKWLGIKTEIVDISNSLKSLGIYKFILSRVPTRTLQGKLTQLAFSVFEKLKGENPFLYSLKGSRNKLVAQGIAHFKSKHRMRMVLVYFFAESHNLLVVGSANKSEEFSGLFCKFGIDHNADIMPINHLFRTQVLVLAEHLGVPSRITAKPSNPDIIPGISDKYEYIAGLCSEKVDLVLFGILNGMSPEEIAQQISIERQKVEYIVEMYHRSEHMRKPSMGL